MKVKVLSRLKRNGTVYEKGDIIEMPRSVFDELRGVVEKAVQKVDVDKEASGPELKDKPKDNTSK